MTLYHTQDGTAYIAATPKELVTMLRKNADFDQSPTDEQHMLLLAKRALDEMGLSLSTESPEAFVASMLKAGLLKEDDNEDKRLL